MYSSYQITVGDLTGEKTRDKPDGRQDSVRFEEETPQRRTTRSMIASAGEEGEL